MRKLKRYLLTSVLSLSLLAGVGVGLVKGAIAYADTYTDYYTEQTADANNGVIKVIVNDIKCVTDPRHARPWIGDVMYFGYSYNDTYGPSCDLSALPVEYKAMYAEWGDPIEHAPEDLERRAKMHPLDLGDVAGYVEGTCKDTDDNYVVYRKVAKDSDTGFFMRARVGCWIEKFEVRKSTDNGATWVSDYEDPRGVQGDYDNIYADEYGYRINGVKANTLYEIKVTITEWPANTLPTVAVKNVTRNGDVMTVDCNLTNSSGDYAMVAYGISVDGNLYLANKVDGLLGKGSDASTGNFSIKVKVPASREVDVKGFTVYIHSGDNVFRYSYVSAGNLTDQGADFVSADYVSDYTSDGEVGKKVDLLGVSGVDIDSLTDNDNDNTDDNSKKGCKGAVAMLSAFMGIVALAVVGKKY